MNVDAMSHRDDPDTSKQAAASQKPHKTIMVRLAVIELLTVEPRTDDELKEAYQAYYDEIGWPELADIHNVARRRSELHKRFGVIRSTGRKRPSRHGSPATVWELAVTHEEAVKIASQS